MTNALADLNVAPIEEVRARLHHCCASQRWVDAMLALRPFASEQAVLDAATATWSALGDDDYLEAFAAHPLIGDVELLRERYAQQAAGDRALAEQGQVLEADEEVITTLAELNQRYLAQHGFIFIVCASGKSAQEMLALLQARVDRTTAQELATAAAEQLKITHIRLRDVLKDTAS